MSEYGKEKKNKELHLDFSRSKNEPILEYGENKAMLELIREVKKSKEKKNNTTK